METKKITLEQIKEHLIELRKEGKGNHTEFDSGFDACLDSIEEFFGIEPSLEDYKKTLKEQDKEDN